MTDSDDDRSLAFEEFDPNSVEPDVPGVEDDQFGTPPDLDEVDVDSETARLFWKLVVVFDVALFALAAGPLLWYFDGKAWLGLQLFGLGLVAFTYGVYRVRNRDVGTENPDDRSTEPSPHSETDRVAGRCDDADSGR